MVTDLIRFTSDGRLGKARGEQPTEQPITVG
jgi:hypothetical protein